VIVKANEFIKKFGWGEAKKTSNPKYETIDNDLHYCTGIKDYTDGFDDYEPCPDCVNIADLKRLVESHEFINERGGLEHVKNLIATKLHWLDVGAIVKTNQAIADVESCQ
jgi:hypothetical protein